MAHLELGKTNFVPVVDPASVSAGRQSFAFYLVFRNDLAFFRQKTFEVKKLVNIDY
jgi:hypothetical protein